MPQGPKGRGCDACRAQKKKCDRAEPSCSRCQRLAINCTGAGVQRFRWVESSRTSPPQPSASSATTGEQVQQTVLVHRPSNANMLLVSEMTTTLGNKDNIRYSISFAWGAALDQIPQRLGRSAALDAAVKTILQDHTDASLGQNSVSPYAPGVRYLFRTLSLLRSVLDDPDQRGKAETLFAVTLAAISLCRFEGALTPFMSVHGQGALQILRMREWPVGRDEFERNLYLSIKGTVVLHSLVDPNCSLGPEDYRGLRNAFQGSIPELQVVQYSVDMSELFAEARRRMAVGLPTDDIATATLEIQQSLRVVISVLRIRLYDADANSQAQPGTQLHAHYQRSYARSLMGHAILLCALKTLARNNPNRRRDIDQLIAHALQLEEEARIYLPLGWRFMSVMLLPGWCVAYDLATRQRIRDVLVHGVYHSEPPRAEALLLLDLQLEFLARRLELKEAWITWKG